MFKLINIWAVCVQALTLTMIAYATFAHSPPESLLTAVSEHALLSLSKFEQQAIANLIWALALLHALSPEMWNQLLEAFSNVDDQQGTIRALALLIRLCYKLYCHSICMDVQCVMSASDEVEHSLRAKCMVPPFGKTS